jgi:hypothetical protein
MPKFTVVGFWSDNEQPWVEHVEAKDGPAALAVALRGQENRVSVEAFAGHLIGCGMNDTIHLNGK